jgi:Uma2 family endonuclease
MIIQEREWTIPQMTSDTVVDYRFDDVYDDITVYRTTKIFSDQWGNGRRTQHPPHTSQHSDKDTTMIRKLAIWHKERQANRYIGEAIAYNKGAIWNASMQQALNRRAEIACWELKNLIG